MGKINWVRVILGGVVAGMIINIFEHLLNGVNLAAPASFSASKTDRLPYLLAQPSAVSPEVSRRLESAPALTRSLTTLTS